MLTHSRAWELLPGLFRLLWGWTSNVPCPCLQTVLSIPVGSRWMKCSQLSIKVLVLVTVENPAEILGDVHIQVPNFSNTLSFHILPPLSYECPSLCLGCLLIGHACLFPSDRSFFQLQVQVCFSTHHILDFQISCFVADSTNDSAVLASDSPTSSSRYFVYSLLSQSRFLCFLIELLMFSLIILHSLAAAPPPILWKPQI